MARSKKNPFLDIPEEWRTEVEQSTTEDIQTKIYELEAVKFASEGYREATKQYRLRMKYALQILEGRGKA